MLEALMAVGLLTAVIGIIGVVVYVVKKGS